MPSLSEALRVNGNQMGLQLGRGAHVVEFRYRPRIFALSIALATVGAYLPVFWAIPLRREARR